MTSSIDPDQTATLGAACSGSALSAGFYLIVSKRKILW